MPFIIRYPAWIAPGGRNQDMITNVDFAPTILEMAGVDIPEEVQGRSFLRNIKGETPDDWPQAMYYHYWQHLLHRDVTAHYGIRTKNRKLIFYYGLALGLTEYGPTPPEWEMFDLEKDPMEMNNIYHDPAYQDEIKELKNQLIELQKKYDDRGEQYPELMEVKKNHFWE